jgi:hypothetical protein
MASGTEITPDKIGMALPSPSEEQLQVIRAFQNGYNVKIEAVAGSGKSTTLLWLCLVAKRDFNANCLLLTYNKTLQLEIQSKLQSYGLESNCAIYTYHGFASKMFKQPIQTDVILRSCLDLPINPGLMIPDIILIDEVQDMNEDYCRLINKILTHGKILILVGDRRQCINTYAGADPKYLIDYANYFNTGRPWKELALRTSYRLTPSMAKFINHHILNDNLIIGGNITNQDILPLYWYNVYSLKHCIEKMATKYGPDEVAILTPSVKNVGNPRSPLGRLMSSKSSVLLTVIDEFTAPESAIGKVVITTWNSFKGRERKCVFVINFDESYFDFYAKDWSRDLKIVPNIIYVAATRAREQLIIVQGDKNPPLRTVKMDDLNRHCKIVGNQNDLKVINLKDRVINVTDLVRHRHLDDVTAMLNLIKIETINSPGTVLMSNEIVQFPGYLEDVRAFYGILIPFYYEYQKLNQNKTSPEEQKVLPTWLNRIISSNLNGETPRYNDHLDLIEYFMPRKDGFADICARLNILLNRDDKTLQHWMEIVVLCTARENRWHFYKDQITNYKWVDSKFIEDSLNRLSEILPPNGQFESIYKYNDLEGIADYVTTDQIWELKCTSGLSEEYKIQTAAYVCLHHLTTGNKLPGRLYNIKSNELIEITVEQPEQFLDILVRRNQPLIPTIES